MNSRDARRKPMQKRSIERVEQILDAVESLVVETGTDCVTTTQVSERMGIAVGTIYQYFDDRDDLLIAAHDRMLSRLATELTAEVAELDLLDSRSIDRIIRSFVRKAHEHPGYIALLNFSYSFKTTRHTEVKTEDFIGHLIRLFLFTWVPDLSESEEMVARTIIANILTVMTNVLLLETDADAQERLLEELVAHCRFAIERAGDRPPDKPGLQ